MLIQFLTVTGWMFWAAVGVLALLEFFFLANEDDYSGAAIFFAVAGLLATILFTDAFNGMRLAWAAAALGGYLVLGVIWAFKKWWDYVTKERDRLRDTYKVSPPKDQTWEQYSNRWRPTAADNKQKITAWMALWPFSFSWWVLTWPRRFFSWAYARLTTVFDRITDRVFAAAR